MESHLLNSDLQLSSRNHSDNLSNFEKKLDSILNEKKSTFCTTRQVIDGTSFSVIQTGNHRSNYQKTLENLIAPHNVRPQINLDMPQVDMFDARYSRSKSKDKKRSPRKSKSPQKKKSRSPSKKPIRKSKQQDDSPPEFSMLNINLRN